MTANVISTEQVLRMTRVQHGSLYARLGSRVVNAHRYGGTMTYSALWRLDSRHIASTHSTYRSTWG